MYKLGKTLKESLKPIISDALTKSEVLGLHKSILPHVDGERKELCKMLEQYEKVQSSDEDLINNIENIIDQAREWSAGLRQKHQELDCYKKPLDRKYFEGLKAFHKDSEMNIFEFISRFEALTEEQGTAKERAILLFETYLSKEIQMDIFNRKDDYQLMRIWLIRQFGDVTVSFNFSKIEIFWPNQK